MEILEGLCGGGPHLVGVLDREIGPGIDEARVSDLQQISSMASTSVSADRVLLLSSVKR